MQDFNKVARYLKALKLEDLDMEEMLEKYLKVKSTKHNDAFKFKYKGEEYVLDKDMLYKGHEKQFIKSLSGSYKVHESEKEYAKNVLDAIKLLP